MVGPGRDPDGSGGWADDRSRHVGLGSLRFTDKPKQLGAPLALYRAVRLYTLDLGPATGAGGAPRQLATVLHPVCRPLAVTSCSLPGAVSAAHNWPTGALAGDDDRRGHPGAPQRRHPRRRSTAARHPSRSSSVSGAVPRPASAVAALAHSTKVARLVGQAAGGVAGEPGADVVGGPGRQIQ